MVLEASMIVVDNSEWMRNGDYSSTRLAAQKDAVNLLANAKLQSNPENTVGLMTMAGKNPTVLQTFITDIGKILSGLHPLEANGYCQFLTSIQIAALTLKHRQNRNLRQRIIVFVGSPVKEDQKELQKAAKKLKKNNINIDIISFGEEAENTTILEEFVNLANKDGDEEDCSHFVSIPPGPHNLSDMLSSTPIIGGADGPSGSGGGNDFEFGIDPNLDPELALALRISLEEEKARLEAEAAKQGKDNSAGESSSADVNTQAMDMDEEEDAELQAALAMSMGQGQSEDVDMEDDHENSLNAVLGSLPGVNPKDEKVQKALDQDKKDKDGKK